VPRVVERPGADLERREGPSPFASLEIHGIDRVPKSNRSAEADRCAEEIASSAGGVRLGGTTRRRCDKFEQGEITSFITSKSTGGVR
jgi:hypothetical protein